MAQLLWCSLPQLLGVMVRPGRVGLVPKGNPRAACRVPRGGGGGVNVNIGVSVSVGVGAGSRWGPPTARAALNVQALGSLQRSACNARQASGWTGHIT